MSANPVPLTPAPEQMAVWRRFRSLSERQIEEGNAVASERIWVLYDAEGPRPRFTIGCTKCEEVHIDCSFDPDSGVLVCKPGPAMSIAPLTFQLLPGVGDRLGYSGKERSFAEAVALMLDQLVWMDEWNCEEEKNENPPRGGVDKGRAARISAK